MGSRNARKESGPLGAGLPRGGASELGAPPEAPGLQGGHGLEAAETDSRVRAAASEGAGTGGEDSGSGWGSAPGWEQWGSGLVP